MMVTDSPSPLRGSSQRKERLIIFQREDEPLGEGTSLGRGSAYERRIISLMIIVMMGWAALAAF